MESVGSYKGTGVVDMDGLYATELRLGLPCTASPPLALTPATKAKRPLQEEEPTVELSSKSSCCSNTDDISSDVHHHDTAPPPPAKAQVVGWPPVQSFRVRSHAASQAKKETGAVTKNQAHAPTQTSSGLLVKVSMDGAPYLRKIDLGTYNGYKHLHLALDAMFSCFSPTAHPQLQSPHNTVTYEDKDGDWMLVGDEPWEMFVSSCNRLRIIKSSPTENRV